MPPPPPAFLHSSVSDDEMIMDEDGQEEIDNVPFRLPVMGSLLRAIYDWLLNEIKSRLGSSNVPDNLNHPLFFKIMNEWESWFKDKEGEERFYPVKIPVPKNPINKKNHTTPPTQHEWWNYIAVRWDAKTIKYEQNPRLHRYLGQSKCKKCWSNGSPFCRSHSKTKRGIFGICQDVNEQTKRCNVTLSYGGASLPSEWSSLLNNGYFKQNTLLQTYMTSHPQHNFIPLYETSISYGSDLKFPVFHTTTVANLYHIVYDQFKTLLISYTF